MDKKTLNLYEFGKSKLRASLLQRDQESIFDRKEWKNLADTGFFRMHVPEKLGGMGLSFIDTVKALSELGKGSLDIPFAVSAVAQLVAIDCLVKFGTLAQQKAYLEPLLSGDFIASICNSESRAGTDIKAIRSRVASDGGLFIEKRGATNLGDADLLFVSVWQDSGPGKKTLEVFLLDRSQVDQTKGVTNLAGFRTGLTGSATAVENSTAGLNKRLGNLSSGFLILRHCFNMERALIGALLGGVLEELIVEAVFYIESHQSFDQPLSNFQYMQDKIIELATAREKISGLLKLVASDSTLDLSLHTSSLAVLKLVGIEEVSSALMAFYETFGFSSYTLSHPAQKLIRDHLALHFLGGTKEQQKMILFNEIVSSLKEPAETISIGRRAPQ